MDYNTALEKIIFLTKRNISQTELGEALGLQRGAINGRAKRNSTFSKEEIKQIEKFFKINLSLSDSDECLKLPKLGELTAGLGSGKDVFSEETTDYFAIPKSLMTKIGANPKYSSIINTDGESMYPTIIGGNDQILIDTSKTEIFDGKIYLIRIENSLFAKRLQKLPKGQLKIISDNPAYDSYIIDFKDESLNFAVIGRVMWVSRPL